MTSLKTHIFVPSSKVAYTAYNVCLPVHFKMYICQIELVSFKVVATDGFPFKIADNLQD